MKTLRNKRRVTCALCFVLLLLFTSCGRANKHCYLCQGIPYEAPCLVDLSTGYVAPLTVSENYDAVSFQILGDARIEQLPWETHATIPAEPQPVSTSLFCEDCMTRIDATPNHGYVLADLSDLSSIQLYPVEGGDAVTIRDYNISISADGGQIQIQVAAP